MILVKAGTPVSTLYTGDEAQIFVRSGQAHIGIGARAYSFAVNAGSYSVTLSGPCSSFAPSDEAELP